MKTLSRYVSRRVRDEQPPFRFATNVALKATADIVSKTVTLVITIAAARLLPAGDFGTLALAMTTGWILSVASDAGLPLFLAKQIAQDRSTGQVTSSALVSRVMRLRVLLGIGAAALGLGVALVIAPRSAIVAFLLIVIAQVLNAVLETLSHAYRGLGRSDIESRLILVQRSVTAVAAIAVLITRPSLLWLAFALLIPPAAALLVSWRIASRLMHFVAGARDDAPHLTGSRFVREIGPLGAGILLSALYFRCDVYFVEWWHGLDAVGVYNATFRIVEALRLFPAAVLAVAFPELCSARDVRPLRWLATTLGAGGLVVMGVVYVTAPAMLDMVYGARFMEAAPALRILALALPLFFINYALTHQLIAWDGQCSYLAITAAALVANVIGNTLLIPAGGMAGAAASTLVTEVVVCTGCVIALHRTLSGRAFLSRPASTDLRRAAHSLTAPALGGSNFSGDSL